MRIRFPLAVALLVVCASATSALIIGGKTHADPQSPATETAAQFAVSSLNHGYDRANLGAVKGSLTLVGVKEVSTQVVAGVNYFMVLVVQDAQGRNHDVAVTVWSRPWLEKRNDANEPAWQLSKAELVNSSN